MKILIMSDSPGLNTGYGQNTYNMLNELDQAGHQVASLALNHAGEPVRFKGWMDVYPGATPFMFAKSIAVYKPDILLHIRDNWVFIPKYCPVQPYSLLELCHRNKVKLINYTPVQATPLPPEFVDTMTYEADFTYITNQVGVDSLVKQGAPKEKVGVMYNGVDSSVFRTFNQSRKGSNLPEDRKLALFVGANMDYRKQIPKAMLAFRKYLNKRDDATLYAHTNPHGGFDLGLFAKNLEFTSKQFILKSSEGVKLMTWDFTTEQMAALYNFGDAFLTCTASEGFNEPALEAFACGLPVVLTDTPIHREIFSCFGERAFFIPAKEQWATMWGFEHEADTDAAAELLEKAFDMGKRPISMRDYPQFSWKRIAAKFEAEARKVLELPFVEPKRPEKKKDEVQYPDTGGAIEAEKK